MDVLMNIWYVISGLIGLVLIVASVVFGVFGVIMLSGILISIKEKDFDDLFFISKIILFCASIVIVTLFVNIAATKYQQQVSTEIPNITSYEGIANVKQGKYNYDYMYFTQGENNNHTILKLDPNKCRIHYTNESEIKVMKNTTKYTSPYRFLAIFNLDENITYDIYLPNNYKR